MSETNSEDLMLELQKFKSEIAKNLQAPNSRLLNNSTLEKFQNEQNEFANEILETLQMMREEAARGLAELAVEMEERQKSMDLKILENLESIEKKVSELEGCEDATNWKSYHEVEKMKLDVEQLKQKDF